TEQKARMDGVYYSLSICVALIGFLLIKFLTKQKSPKKLPPSPPSIPIIGHLYLLKAPIYNSFRSLSNKYGQVLLLKLGTRRVLLVTSASAVEECFTTNDIIFASRPTRLRAKHLMYDHTTVDTAPYGDLWRNLRRFLTLEIFSSARLATTSVFRQEEVRLWASGLVKQCQIKEPAKVELKSKFSELTFNIVTMMILGRRYYGEHVRESDTAEAAHVRAFMEETFKICGMRDVGDNFPFLWRIDFRGKKILNFAEKKDKVFQKWIDDFRASTTPEANGDSSKRTLIQVLLSLQQCEPEFYTDKIIKGIILVLVLGGADTTATTMEWAMCLLLNHPEALKKARAEIDDKIGQSRLIAEEDLPKLTYLKNIINETLRLYPPAPILLPRCSSDECMVGGFDVPRNTTLMVNAWAIQRDPKVWKDPESFIPERFEGEAEFGYWLIPFGGGRRGCPGAVFGGRVVALALGVLIQLFEWERVADEEVDMTERFAFTMEKADSLEAICRPREAINLLFK
ncbi:Cytochrome P450, partial [Dillenia turbinata]